MHARTSRVWAPEYVEQLMDGLRKAGLEIAGERLTD